MNKKVEKWHRDVLRTVKWLRAIVGMPHADVVIGKPHDLDPDAATAGDRMADWFSGAGQEPTNVQRFRDAAAVLRKTPPEGWPVPAPTPETAPTAPETASAPTAPTAPTAPETASETAPTAPETAPTETAPTAAPTAPKAKRKRKPAKPKPDKAAVAPTTPTPDPEPKAKGILDRLAGR